MSARKPRKAAVTPVFRPGQLLDWSSSRHWNYDGPAACRYCGRNAFLLDGHRHPAHKVCAEQALAVQHAEATKAYGAQTL